MKVIHCADVHLGAGISSFGAIGVTRAAEIKNTFMNILRLCRDEAADYLLIAGDLFDSAIPPQGLVKEVAEGFAGIPGTKVIITPGNHDCAVAGSCYLNRELWSDNVYIFSDKWSHVEFPEDGVRVFGGGFTSVYQIEPLLDFEQGCPGDGFINIGVLHGDLVSAGGESNYNPVTERQIGESGLDYLALGHIHARSGLKRAGRTVYAYAGCPEGRGFDELGEKGVYVGTVDKTGCHMEFRRMCRRIYAEEEVDISRAGDSREAAFYIQKHLEKYGEDYRKNLYKIILTGKVQDGALLSEEDIGAAAETFYIRIKNETRRNVDYERVAGQRNLKGMFVGKMLEKIKEYENKGKMREADLYREALEAGYLSFR